MSNYHNIAVRNLKGEELLSFDFLNREKALEAFQLITDYLYTMQPTCTSKQGTLQYMKIGKYVASLKTLPITYQILDTHGNIVETGFDYPIINNFIGEWVIRTIPSDFVDE